MSECSHDSSTRITIAYLAWFNLTKHHMQKQKCPTVETSPPMEKRERGGGGLEGLVGALHDPCIKSEQDAYQQTLKEFK